MKIYNIASALLIAIALSACSHKHGHTSHEHYHGDASHEHSHDKHVHDGHTHDERLLLTAYNSDFEVFAEATPFVVGQSSEILAHFSHLENFKPLTEGIVTARIIIGADELCQHVEQPIKNGIYLFSVTPTTIGTGKLIFDIQTANSSSQLVLSNIQIYNNEHDAYYAAAEAEISSSNGVTFTKEQSWKVEFATEEVKHEPFGQIIRATAQIQPSQIDEKVLTAKTNGVVAFAGNDIVEGKTVNTEQSLFSIESGGLADNNLDVRFAEATSEYNLTKTEYERRKELTKDRIVSEREFLEAETAYKNAEAVYKNLQENFASGKQVIRSPINGFIKQVLVRNGEYAETGQPVLVVSQNRDLLIKAALQPKYFDVLNTIETANIKIMNRNLSYTLEELNGKVVSYGKSTDLSNPLIPVLFQVQNNIGLLPGSFVEMYIKLHSGSYALTVPKEAIVEEMGAFFTFVQLTPEYFEKRSVKTGKTDSFRTEILQGLSANERVVSKGAILVKLAQISESLDAHSGHVH